MPSASSSPGAARPSSRSASSSTAPFRSPSRSIPILILVSFFIGGTPFTLAIPPLLAIAVGLAVLVVTIVTVDGEADMTDGAALCGLYVIIAALFWWG